MGSFDGAEIRELVDLYLLVGLYIDNGLTAVNSSCGPLLDKMRKKIIALIKNEGLSITIETNLFEMDFLDVTFNLVTGKFFPFRKPNNQLLYINVKSNHPPTIIRYIPDMINKRLSDLSFNEEEYEKAKSLYEPALTESGCKRIMTYTKTKTTNNRNRPGNIIWFNQLYNLNVKTIIGKTFLRLIKKHFSRDHTLYKIFNKNTLNLSAVV